MFGRFQPKLRGFNSSNDNASSDPQSHNLRQLGLLNTSQISFSAPPSSAKAAAIPAQRMPRAAVVGPLREQSSYPEKSHSIALGTIKPPSDRSSISSRSIRSRDSGSRSDPTSSGMMSQDRSRNRRERTFVGSECAVCEEPLEHTLRGEKILQFSCSHVAHEACFYEFMRELESQSCPTCNAPLHLDTSRGGNVLDIEKISNMVRSAVSPDLRGQKVSSPTLTSHWEDTNTRPPSRNSSNRQGPPPTSAHMSYRESREGPYQSFASPRHTRNESESTGLASTNGYSETTQSGPARRHDYDLQAMETSLAHPRSMARNPIPSPSVTIRSEFPTINRSRQQQTLTCLVTVEVSDNKWRPDPNDLRTAGAQNQKTEEGSTVGAPSTAKNAPRFYPYEAPEVLEEMTESLRSRVDNWHGLDFGRFGKLRLYGTLRVGKDKISWQELECYLFAEMLICVKEKKTSSAASAQWDDSTQRKSTRCTLKGSILIKQHLNKVTDAGNMDENVLTLSLSVNELPQFHLRFENRNQLKLWQQALLDLNAVENSPIRSPEYERGDVSELEEEEWRRDSMKPKRVSSAASSWGGGHSVTTAPTEYTGFARSPFLTSIHVPIDVVVVVPISSSMQGVKINLVRDALRFMVHTLGERDRMGLVTFGSGGGGVPIVGMTTKAWPGWTGVLSSIKPVGQKSHRADVVEGANVAMDLLMQRKYNNPVATIMLISDSSTSDSDSVDFVVSRAEAAKITIHSFGLGMTHKPDTMIELSTRTKASYTYVKDWMMLRECLAGCLGSMQTLSHQNVKLKLKLPEGSPAKFHKISGALQITKRATGRDAEASLGDLRFGDKRDILVQLIIMPDTMTQEHLPQDAWENIISGLEALGGPAEQENERTLSVEEVPLIQADLNWGDILREGAAMQLPRPSLLAITMLPANSNKKSWNGSPPIPPHPSIVQRRMELLTSDMLTRALTLVSRGQHDRAHTLLHETRSILKGLGKGGLPPVPPVPSNKSSSPSTSQAPASVGDSSPTASTTPDRKRTPSPPYPNDAPAVNGHTPVSGPNNPNGSNISGALPVRPSNDGMHGMHSVMSNSAGIDATTVAALDSELESSLEWINHPAVFGRDSRKAVLQSIGVISSQRAFTYRTPIETLWAARISGVKKLTESSREWREGGGGEGGGIMEEA